jgi:hypothetical protein
MTFFSSRSQEMKSTAKVVDGALVLSLPDAIEPVVWRMDLSETKAAALQIKEIEGTFVLTMKGEKTTAKDIAPFDSKEKALGALMQISHALGNTGAVSRYIGMGGGDQSNDDRPPKVQKKSNMMALFIGVGILVVLIFMLSNIGPQTANFETTGEGGNAQEAFRPAAQGGVAVPADQFLMNR